VFIAAERSLLPSPALPLRAALGKRERARLAAAAAQAEPTSDATAAAAAAADFARLTELADLLLSAGGELDVYSNTKEQLQRWAAAVLPQSGLLDGEPRLQQRLSGVLSVPWHSAQHVWCVGN
jgi:hypothetical protein